MQQNKLYEEFISKLSNLHQPEESLLALFTMLIEKIPFTSLLCYVIHRKTRKAQIYIDFAACGQVQMNYSLILPNIVSREEIYESFIDKENRINIRSDTQNEHELWANMQGHKGEYRSSLFMVLNDDVPNDIFHSLLMTAPEPRQFTEEHVKILGALREPIQELTNRYFVSTPEPHLVLSMDGPLPTSSEALLRRCPGLSGIMQKINVLAESDSTILIKGPTGSGKELVADALHVLSKRIRKPFIKVNCGSIPESLVDSSFFGFEKGSFTGAISTRQGYFEQAHEGTLYLDEVGELSLRAQVSLLRVLETKEIQRIGGNRLIPLDVRFVAATHRDLWAMVEEGTFREDLYYRLNIYPLFVPPLNERPKDIPILVEYFYTLYTRQFDMPPLPLSLELVKDLQYRAWPGNVRQLRYVMERALLDAKIQIYNGQRPSLNLETAHAQNSVTNIAYKTRERHTPDAAMKQSILEVLEQCKGKIHGPKGAAAQLGVNPSTLRSRMKRLEIAFGKIS